MDISIDPKRRFIGIWTSRFSCEDKQPYRPVLITSTQLPHFKNIGPGLFICMKQLSNDSTLRWTLSNDPALAGYRLVWRESDAAAWQFSQDVGLVSQITVPISKDNVLFGVQSLSKRGHASLAVYPLPQGR